MTPQIAKTLFQSFESSLKSCYVWIEDVYITGVLAQMNGIKISNLQKYIHLEPHKDKRFISFHAGNISLEERITLWHKYFD